MAHTPRTVEIKFHAVIEPGSRVLVAVDRSLSLEHAQRMSDRMRERFPGVEFTWVEASAIAVMPPDDGTAS